VAGGNEDYIDVRAGIDDGAEMAHCGVGELAVRVLLEGIENQRGRLGMIK
jgi:hypothetical protein